LTAADIEKKRKEERGNKVKEQKKCGKVGSLNSKGQEWKINKKGSYKCTFNIVCRKTALNV
jgi:hypothetical protein